MTDGSIASENSRLILRGQALAGVLHLLEQRQVQASRILQLPMAGGTYRDQIAQLVAVACVLERPCGNEVMHVQLPLQPLLTHPTYTAPESVPFPGAGCLHLPVATPVVRSPTHMYWQAFFRRHLAPSFPAGIAAEPQLHALISVPSGNAETPATT
jgi:hypothetical protein